MRQNTYQYIVGVDEVGRGPLAGPVVAGAVLLCGINAPSTSIFQELRDSKQLTAAKREHLYSVFTNHPNIIWGIGRVSEKTIDNINIFKASKLAMALAIQNLEQKLRKGMTIDTVVIDGNMTLDIDFPQLSIVKADEKILSCSAASVIAKVARDRIMARYHKLYPAYRFDMHKGYGTKDHIAALLRHGPCNIHRKSFYPVSTL